MVGLTVGGVPRINELQSKLRSPKELVSTESSMIKAGIGPDSTLTGIDSRPVTAIGTERGRGSALLELLRSFEKMLSEKRR